MQEVKSVKFNAGGDQTEQFALVVGGSGNTLDLLVCDAEGNWQRKDNVPRRDPSDYGPEGGGHTWHS